MLQAGKAVKISIYVSEGSTHHGVPTFSSILDFLFYRGVSCATAYRGIEGYGTSTRIRHANHWTFSKDASITFSIIDTEDQINLLIPHLDAMVGEGLIAVSRVDVIRYSKDPATIPRKPNEFLRILQEIIL